MHFKKLELIGFKSFADKTTIEFPSGVTAIVGPNGCGKSNIADAIRWVLGEQSVKSLRGSDMQDVIFNGSAVKQPLNFAEVSLTLSNESKILLIEYDEVTICRRLYRSGESEYLLNQNTVRLKDIQELLMGTGIGTDSYAIIEQGRMDVILNSKPEDRRAIFEEAAGITKYKSKKKEALRKLEQTDANLLRINDILQEVKRQIGSIERQAKRAESYKKEFEKLKKLELWAASKEFLVFESEKKIKEDVLGSLKEEEALSHVAIEEIEARHRTKKGSLEEIEESLRQTNLEEMTISADARKHRDRALLNRERIGELSAKKENLEKAIDTSRLRTEELGQECEALSEQIRLMQNSENPEEKKAWAALEKEFTSYEASLRALRGERAAEELRSQEIARESVRLHREAAEARAQGEGMKHRFKKLTRDKEVLLSEIRETDESLRGSFFDPDLRESASFSSEDLFSRVRLFKEKIVLLVKRLVAERRETFSGEEEAGLDADLARFAEEVSQLKVRSADVRARREHLDLLKKRAEEKIGLIESECRSLGEEEDRLRQKEKISEDETLLLAEEDRVLKVRLEALEEAFRAEEGKREALLVRLTESRLKRSQWEERRGFLEKDRQRALDSKRGEDSLRVSYENEIRGSLVKKETLEKECVELEAAVAALLARRDEILKSTESVRRSRQSILDELKIVEDQRQKSRTALDEIRQRSHELEMQRAQTGFEMDRLKERIFNAYQVDLTVQQEIGQTDAEFFKEILGGEGEPELEGVKARILAQRERIGKMGPVNLVAIEEFDEMRTRYEFLSQQEADLVKAKEDLHKAIQKINRTTRELFADTFQKIQGHFSDTFRLLFGGGSAELILLDEEDVLESGIEIVARPPGKKLQSITLLSGGEKALTATALLFALFKVRPSPFCVLDEIDAPLDEANVDRFLGVLREFIAHSQFIVITHSKRTMNLADALYGITMAETGVSRVVSVKFQEKKNAELVT